MTLVKGHGTEADKEFKAALKARLKASHFPAYRLAMELGISQGQLSGLLTDARSASLGQMEKIAKSLGTSVGEMLMEGKILIGKTKTDKLQKPSPHAEAIEAFQYLMLTGGEAAELLADQAIRLAQKRRAEELQNDPTTRQGYKSAS